MTDFFLNVLFRAVPLLILGFFFGAIQATYDPPLIVSLPGYGLAGFLWGRFVA